MVRKTAKLGLLALLLVLLGVAGAAAFANRDSWLAYFQPAAEPAADEHKHAHPDRVAISPQAQAKLALDVRPIELASEPYWQTITVPGTIIERPGACEYSVASPLVGVVAEILVIPGEVVKAGRPLFKLRLTGDALHSSQTELFRTVQDLTIADEQYQRMLGLQGTVPQTQILEVQYQQRRLRAREKSLRFELETHGLSKEHLGEIVRGQFVTHIEVKAPQPLHAAGSGHWHDADSISFEVEEMKVGSGEQVERGDALCILSEHRALFVEGAVYRNEIPLVQRAAENHWPVHLDFPDVSHETDSMWSPLPRLTAGAVGMLGTPSGAGALAAAVLVGSDSLGAEGLTILSVGSRADAESQTAPLYLRLLNEYREYQKDGRTFRNWRYRPGQRTFVRIPVKSYEDVFVLPAAAVAYEGAEAFVFRQNGDAFERRPVHVVYRDQRSAVIAHDGGIGIGNYIARNGAAHLLRALKMQSAAGDSHGHHHDH